MYKTVLCHQYKATGNCTFNNKCRYAQGQDELQPISNHPLYKTILCRSYHNYRICNYGAKCKFMHELSEKRVPTPGKVSQQPVILVLPSNMTLKQFTQIQKSENMEQTKQLSSQNKSVNLLSESQHSFLESIKCQAKIPTMSSDHLLSMPPCHSHVHTLPTLEPTSKNSSKTIKTK